MLYDRRSRFRKLKTGSKVLVLLPTSHNKLLMQWKGPFTVISKQGACDYIIQMGSKTKVFHINMLKQYLERSNSSSISNNRTHIANTTCVISETEDTTSD